ncbi:hypothetical protein ACU4GD_24175 [Cupriavidus basilensis]
MTLSCSGPTAILPATQLLEKVRPRLVERIREIESVLRAQDR